MRVILITGSTSGIGLAIAESFASDSENSPEGGGTHIAITGLGTPEEIAKAKARIENCGKRSRTQCTFFPADFRDMKQVEALIHDVIGKLGRLDVLINNAGVQYVSPVERFPLDKWQLVMDLNLTSVFVATKAAVPQMRKQGFGRIINIASAHGKFGSPYKAAYVASKHGVVGLTKVVALEVAEAENLTCNALCPGWVLTPLVEKQIRDKMAQEREGSFEVATQKLVGGKMPSRRPLGLDEVGRACVWLAHPSTKSVQGAAISIDGGWTAGTVAESERPSKL